MPELRKDYLLDRWVLINERRGKRPNEFTQRFELIESTSCPFCPGNEAMTPLETMRFPAFAKEWKMRVFPNKFAAVSSTDGVVTQKRGLLQAQDALGAHEVVVETPKHGEQLWDLSPKELAQMIKIFQDRIKALQTLPYVEYVVVFHNQGRDAGASLQHCHSQIIAINHLPQQIKEYLTAFKKLKKRNKHCPLCDVLKIERKSQRFIAENKNAIAIAPFASRFNFEAAVFPRAHKKSMVDLKENEIHDFAELLHKLLLKLKELYAPLNINFIYSPKEDFHFFAVIEPKLSIWAGFEFGSGIIINIMPPEKAAAFYRGEKFE
jgi:UDPglucose--hexose-1-phosphate uridylyltransferase